MAARVQKAYQMVCKGLNVIVIMLDSLRKDHLECYGNKWIKTPNIDKLAKESVIFTGASIAGSGLEGQETNPYRLVLEEENALTAESYKLSMEKHTSTKT